MARKMSWGKKASVSKKSVAKKKVAPKRKKGSEDFRRSGPQAGASINGILASPWAKFSMLMVILALGTNIVGAWLLSGALRKRVEYGEANHARWVEEFRTCVGAGSPWPFTRWIDSIGIWMRIVKASFTLLAGALLSIGAILR